MSRLPDGSHKPRISVRLEPDQYAYLQARAMELGQRVSDVVRGWLDKGIKADKRARKS